MAAHIVGVDVGTTNVKAVLIDAEGRILAESTAEYETRFPHPGCAEQDSTDWWDATVRVLSDVTASQTSTADIKAVGVSSQAPGLVPLDSAGAPLRNALIWMDTRSAGQCEWLGRTIGVERIKAITGNRPDPSYLLSKILWFKQHEPELLARTQRILTTNGYIVWRLTNQSSIDISHASLSQLYDVQKRGWSTELCDVCGIRAELFPRVYETAEIVGAVNGSAATATGLPAGVPVVAGIVDANAAGLAVGVVGSGDGAIVMGTSTVLLVASDSWVECGDLAEIYHAEPGSSVVFGAMSTTGASLKWFRDQFGETEKEQAGREGRDVYELLTAQAAQVQPGAGDLIFLPYMMGERAPIWDSRARGTLFGLSLKTTRAHIIRAILEGVAFGLSQVVGEARRIGLDLDRLTAVGAGGSETWFKIMASVLGIPLQLPDNPGGAALGAALLAGVGAGVFQDLREIANQVAVVAKTIEPDPAWQAHYQELFAIYLDLYPRLKHDMHRLAALRSHV